MTSQSGKIGVATATIIGMNAMIGSGIFSAPATMASAVGPAGILAYLFVMGAVLFIALSLARLAYLYPQSGSFYLYAKQWSGHVGGLIASGAYFIGLLIAMGLLTQMAGTYLHDIFPALNAYTWSYVILSALVVLNIFGVALSEVGQHILIVLTVFPLLAITALCLSKAHITNLTPFAPYGFLNVLKATRVVVFGFFGFECATSLFNIVKHPEKNVPKALTYSILIVGVIYTLFVGSIIASTPMSLFNDASVPLPRVLANLFPTNPWLIKIIHVSVLSAIVGTIHSMIWASSNLLSILGHQIHHKARLSHRTAVLIVACGILLSTITFKNINLFFYCTALFIITALVMSIITLLTLRSEWKNGHNIIAVLGLATAVTIGFFAFEGLIEQLHHAF